MTTIAERTLGDRLGPKDLPIRLGGPPRGFVRRGDGDGPSPEEVAYRQRLTRHLTTPLHEESDMEPNVIRCSFIVNEVARVRSGGTEEGEVLRATACTDKEGKYAEFFHYTPGGSMEIRTLRKTGFAPGDRLQVDISVAERAPLS